MTDSKPAKKTAAKKVAAKKPVKKVSPQDELQKAIDKARKAGLTVRAHSVATDESGTLGREH